MSVCLRGQLGAIDSDSRRPFNSLHIAFEMCQGSQLQRSLCDRAIAEILRSHDRTNQIAGLNEIITSDKPVKTKIPKPCQYPALRKYPHSTLATEVCKVISEELRFAKLRSGCVDLSWWLVGDQWGADETPQNFTFNTLPRLSLSHIMAARQGSCRH